MSESTNRTPLRKRSAGGQRKPRSVAFILTVIAVPLAVLLLGVVLAERAPGLHPYVVYEMSDALRVVVIQHPRHAPSECKAEVERMVTSLRTYCSACRLAEFACLDKLDARQRKIASGRPVDIPIVQTPKGRVAFISGVPEVALQVCTETERQAVGNMHCVTPAAEGLALAVAAVGDKVTAELLPAKAVLIYAAVLALAISWLTCFAIVRFEHKHGHFSFDLTATGPQKFHAVATPRVGGVALALALAIALFLIKALDWLPAPSASGITMLALAALPAFAGGLGEDVTKRVSVLARLMLTISAGVIGSLLVGATLDRLDVPGVDTLLQWPLFAIVLTAIAVGGIANAMNIIDGYNGLVGGYGILVLAALAWVAAQVGDTVVLAAALVMLGALAGFLAWNYPKGRVFLGDGGAYLLGFWLAELSVLLVVRNPDVSPWFPMLLLAYPIVETLFSIYRRALVRGGHAGHPDALHLHQLIYTRLVRRAVGSRDPKAITERNSAVAPYVWGASALLALPAVLLWQNTPALIACTAVFTSAYWWLYRRLVRWNAPSWLLQNGRRR